MVSHWLPTSSNVRWNIHTRANNTVFENREDLIQCFKDIWESGNFDPRTFREVGAMDLLEHWEVLSEPFSYQAPEETLNQHPAFLSGHTKHHVTNIPVSNMSTLWLLWLLLICHRNSLHSTGEQGSGSVSAKRHHVLYSQDHHRVTEKASLCCTNLSWSTFHQRLCLLEIPF